MSEQQQIVRVTDNVRIVNGRKDPSARFGFQKCGLMTGYGMFETFDRMFSPTRNEAAMPAGDYFIQPKPAYVDQRGNVRIGFDLVPVKK